MCCCIRERPVHDDLDSHYPWVVRKEIAAALRYASLIKLEGYLSSTVLRDWPEGVFEGHSPILPYLFRCIV